MSDYRLEFNSVAGPHDTDRLCDLLSIISEGDEVEIIIQKRDSEQADAVIGVLKENNFHVSSMDEGGQIRLIARRISTLM